jgi:hypothetical protein
VRRFVFVLGPRGYRGRQAKKAAFAHLVRTARHARQVLDSRESTGEQRTAAGARLKWLMSCGLIA